VKIFTNHSGTTQDTFSIGKRGVELIRGYGSPHQHHAHATVGSLYFQTELGILLVKRPSGEWDAMATQASVQLSMVMVSQTIERCVRMALWTMAGLVVFVTLMLVFTR
jgi:hypothetical protein